MLILFTLENIIDTNFKLEKYYQIYLDISNHDFI